MSKPFHIAAWALQTPAMPSASCLQWSPDGQLIVTTKNAVFILTPDDGTAVHPDAAVKNPFVNEEGPGESRAPLGFFKTMIEFDRAVAHHWPTLTTDWAASSIGALDIYLRSVAVSPADPVGSQTSMLAVLNTNFELTLWSATKNHLRGVWIMIQDVTAYLRGLSDEDRSEPYSTICVQASCIAWSPQPDFGLVPRVPIDASLFAVATRACEIRFLQLAVPESAERGFRYVNSAAVGTEQITDLAWSAWTIEQAGSCYAWLACACVDGSVCTLRITQSLNGTSSDRGLLPPLGQAGFSDTSALCEADGCGITAMKYVDTINNGRALVVCKPGKVQIVRLDAASKAWSSFCALDLETQDLTSDSSAYYPVSGIEYIEHDDSLILSLYDGSFHVITHLSTTPQVTDPATCEGLSSEALSLQARTAFVKIESREARPLAAITRHDANRTSGMTSYDGGRTFAWLHESLRPNDFSYKHDAKHTSFLVVAPLWDDDVTSHLLSTLRGGTSVGIGHSTLSVLRPIFHTLRNRAKGAELVSTIVRFLQDCSPEYTLPAIDPPTADKGDVQKHVYSVSLATHLFGWPEIVTLRQRFAMVEFLQTNLPRGSDMKPTLEGITSTMLRTLTHWHLWVIVRHLSSASPQLSEDDIPLGTRLGVQAMLSGGAEALMVAGQEMMAAMAVRQPQTGSDPLLLPTFEESCPACKKEVKFEGALKAQCEGGHVWQRCSITSFVLSTPTLRTCVGCNRKAFMPLGEDVFQPHTVRGWFVQELLKAVTRCLFCGNTFVTLV